MTRHDPQVALTHMHDYAKEAIDLVSGVSRNELEHHRVLVLALTRLVEIIGEAATRVQSAGPITRT